ncbi:MAG TPA: HAD family hydrolase [bacterium]|nr:HAD family hydrolase [bacterium]
MTVPADAPGRRAVFLDRDGVLIADAHHLRSVDQLRVLPGVPEALVRLRAAGWVLIVATNQSVVARGWVSEEELRHVHRVLLAMLRERGASLDAIYYCPHHPEGAVPAYRVVCECRKPNPGMLLRAAAELGLDLSASVMVGDAASDVETGRRAGCRTVLVRADAAETGAGGTPAPDYIAADLDAAAAWIVALPRHPGSTAGGRDG